MATESPGIGEVLDALRPLDDWPIGRLFAAASRMSSPVVSGIIEQHGMSPAGFFLLRELLIQDGQRPGELARRLMITPATTTSIVDTLERNGHVERRRDDRDRRAVLLHITGSGRQLIGETGSAIGSDLGRLYDVVDEADVPAVRRFLLGLIQRLGEHPSSKGDCA